MGMSTGKMEIDTIDGSKYCDKKEWKTMIVGPGSLEHPSSGANRPSDVAFRGIIRV
jgi:hypothetical protein